MVLRSKTLRLLSVTGGVSPLGKGTGLTGWAPERHRRRAFRQHPVVTYRANGYRSIRRNLKALATTDTELKLIAAAAMTGDSRMPKLG